LEFLGRIDEQVKVRGYRIELGEVETVLRQHPQVSEAVVVVREGATSDQQLVAYIVTEDGAEAPASELRGYLKEQLPEYMMPAVFVVLNELPLTSSGKIDRRALPAPVQAQQLGRDALQVARTPVEELLMGVWANVLGLEHVTVQDSFFELGGHSLLAAQIVSRVRDVFGVELPLRSVFEMPVLSELAEELQRSMAAERAQPAPAIGCVKRDKDPPLSFAQQRLWFLDQLEPHNFLYNIPLAVKVSGSLGLPLFKRSLEEIVRRHEVLRTTFCAHDGQAVQIITTAQAIALPLIDLSTLAEAEQQRLVQLLSREEAASPFDLAHGPLLRTTVLRLAETEHIVLLTMHHIISDAWSMNLLVNEVATLCQAYSRGEETPLPELAVQYADYAVWQREWLQGEVLAEQLAYWREQLGEELPVLELPTDFPRPVVQSHRGSYVEFVLPAEVTRGLQELSRRESVTMFMTLLAGFAVLLSRYANQQEVAIGAPIAGRTQLAVESLIGFFVNTLVLRVGLEGESSFVELLEHVREVTLGAYAHQDVPFEKLVEELQPERNLSRSPLFDVMFIWQEGEAERLALPDLTFAWIKDESGERSAKFDLTLTMQANGEQLHGVIEYKTDLFKTETIKRMVEHFQVLIAEVVDHPEWKLNQYALMSGSERRLILRQWNDTHRDYEEKACLHQLFERQAASQPEIEALISGEVRLSYGDLNRRANQLAHHLLALGVGPESRVGVMLERSIELVISLLGILKAGAAYVPLDVDYPFERLSFMLTDAEIEVLLTESRLKAGLIDELRGVVCLYRQWEMIAGVSTENTAIDVDGDNLAYGI
jgi:acyl carrier protein